MRGATQNENHSRLALDKTVQEHGHDSQSAKQRKQWLDQALHQKQKAVERAAMRARQILSASTTLDDDE